MTGKRTGVKIGKQDSRGQCRKDKGSAVSLVKDRKLEVTVEV